MYIVLLFNSKNEVIKEKSFSNYYEAYSFLQDNNEQGEIVEGWY